MNELISKEKAIEVLERAKQNIRRNIERAIGRAICEILDEVENGIKQLPPIQPEIVRCGECKWFQCNMRQDGYLPKGVDEFECRHWCGYCDPTDFCSYAERREVTT